MRARHRIGRCARSASRRAAHGLRRRRGQPVPRLRDARRLDAARARSKRCRTAQAVDRLHQGAQRRHPQGDVEDGDLGAAELLRRADLRGDRARAGVRGRVLHLDGVAHRRRRHRRHCRGSAPAAPAGLRAAGRRRRRISIRAANTSGAATASSTCSIRRRSSSSSTRRGAASTRSTATTPGP